jgi:hypothetical protein
MGRKVENAHCRNTEGLVDGMGGVDFAFSMLWIAYVEFFYVVLLLIVTYWLYWINCNCKF